MLCQQKHEVNNDDEIETVIYKVLLAQLQNSKSFEDLH